MALTKVSTDGVKDDAITKTKIPANQIEASELADNAVDTNAIANNAVTAGKLASGVQTTINNNAANRIITGSGSANTLEANSNFTYTGSVVSHSNPSGLAKLEVKGGVSGGALGASLTLRNTDAANNGLTDIQFLDAGSNTYAKIQGTNLTDSSNNGFLSFFTSSATSGLTERVTINDSGKVGIGTNSPAQKLHVQDSSDVAIHILKTGSQDTLIKNTGQTEICAASGGGSGQRIVFKIGANTGALNDIAKFTDTGLCFGSDTAAANALDDYEEGTWSPGIDRSASSMSGVTYSYSTGTYTRVGRLVTVWFDFNVTANGTSGGGVPYVTELPFTALYGSGGGTNNGGYGAPTFRDITLIDTNFRIYGSSAFIQNRQIYLYAYNSSGNQVAATLNSTGRITGQATYMAS